MTTEKATRNEMIDDIVSLYERGYISSEVLSSQGSLKGADEQKLRAILNLAGYSDEQIDTRNYL